MKFAPLLLILLLSACAATHPAVPTATTAANPPAPVTALDIHAKSCLFFGSALPPIEVMPPPGQKQPIEPFTVRTTYYNRDFSPVTRADAPGRYGAVVEITASSGRVLRRFLTLYRTPHRVDWDGARLQIKLGFSPEFGVDSAAADPQHEMLGEFVKEIFHKSAARDSDAAILLAGLAEAKIPDPAQPFVARDGFIALDQNWWATLKKKTGLPGLPYLIYQPQSSGPNSKRPLILFLHGSGEAGDGGKDLAKVQSGGLAKMLKNPAELPSDFPFIVVMPQCPPDQIWSPYELVALLDEVQSKYPVDPDRIYLTGLSLGGYGTWDTAIAFPERFAAIAPVCGAGDPADVARVKDLPAWVFHGQDDPTVPIYEAHRMVGALEKIHGRVRLTIYPHTGHNAWTAAYRTAELYAWFLQQRRGQPAHRPFRPQ